MALTLTIRNSLDSLDLRKSHPKNLASCKDHPAFHFVRLFKLKEMPIFRLSSCEEFEELSLENKPIVIEFWAAWCEPCKHITPTFEALSDQTTDLTFLLVDVDDKTFGFEFSRAHEVRAMPTFQIIVDGVKVSERGLRNISAFEWH